MNKQTKTRLNDHPVPEQPTDRLLLQRFVKRKCKDSMRKLVDRHAVMVSSVCRSVCSDPNNADDAFQATFLALVRRSEHLGNVNSLAAWLCRVAYNAAVKVQQVGFREKNVTWDVHEAGEARSDFQNGGEDPWQEIAARETLDILLTQISKLPRDYRECLTLYYFEDLSRPEIAQRMGCSISSIKARLQRGKSMLRAGLLRAGVCSTSAFALVAIRCNVDELSTLSASTVLLCHGVLLSTSGVVSSLVAQLSRECGSLTQGVSMTGKAAIVSLICLVVCGTPFLLQRVVAHQSKEPVNLVLEQASKLDRVFEVDRDEPTHELPTPEMMGQLKKVVKQLKSVSAKEAQRREWSSHKRRYAKEARTEGEREMLMGLAQRFEEEANELRQEHASLLKRRNELAAQLRRAK